MNKTQLIDVVANESGLKKKEAEAAVNAALKAIEDALIDGDRVQLIGFGNFEVKETKEREGINPQTQEKIKIAASKRPTFSASKALKAKLNG